MARVKVKSVPPTYPFGKERVDTQAPSTGPYGKRVAGTAPRFAVAVRGRVGAIRRFTRG